MRDLLLSSLLFGVVGWFLLTYLLALGGRQKPLSAFSTLFVWLLIFDPIFMFGEMLFDNLRHGSIGWRFVLLLVFFAALPYPLCVLRLRWLGARR